MAQMMKAIEQRFQDVATAAQNFEPAAEKSSSLGCPPRGELKVLEDRTTPRSQFGIE